VVGKVSTILGAWWAGSVTSTGCKFQAKIHELHYQIRRKLREDIATGILPHHQTAHRGEEYCCIAIVEIIFIAYRRKQLDGTL